MATDRLRAALQSFRWPRLLLLVCVGWAAPPAWAATLTVTTLDDAGPGSLREALATSAPGDTIDFAVTGTLTLTSAQLTVTKDTVIAGPGADALTIRSSSARKFAITVGAVVTMRDLTIRDGRAGIHNEGTLRLERVTVRNHNLSGAGGGIWNSGSLAVSACLFEANYADMGGAIYSTGQVEVERTEFVGNLSHFGAAAIHHVSGALAVRDSSFEGNVTDGGGAIRVDSGATADIQRSLVAGNDGTVQCGAGLTNFGTTTLTNCTLSGNFCNGFHGGGAIYSTGTLTATHCTIAFNSAGHSAGGVLSSGSFTARNTLFAGNRARPINTNPDFEGTLTSLGHNLIQDPSGTIIMLDATGNLLGVDPLLGPLQDNGGPTRTHAAGAPIIDAGDNTDAPPTDQRGFSRVADGDGDGTATADIGAYEAEAPCVDEDGDGYSTCDGDCVDSDAAVHPGRIDLPGNDVDEDCDGSLSCDPARDWANHRRYVLCVAQACRALLVEGQVTPRDCAKLVIDAAHCDGFGTFSEADNDGDGVRSCSGDCDDFDPSSYPGAEEVCDGIDNDCNRVVPGNENDADHDGYRSCDGDCNDLVNASHPGALELCDGLDNDCDGFLPGEQDADLDGYRPCNGDCDDATPSSHPGALEFPDGTDNDCDGIVDELPCPDEDLDGYSTCEGDCDDATPSNHPGAPEFPDGQDNDCDGIVDNLP